MKIDQLICPLETSGSFEATEFTIDDSAYAFELLIKRLYKDPITSIVREITSNAWDSHIEARNEATPVTVLFPTSLDPHFTVEDQGTGLSPDQIKNLYTVLFRSNRRDSNEFLGGYGLGSKSPLAYTDQFTVISRWQAFEFQYAVFTNEQGKPSITILSQTDTDEPNGVTIRIPVSPGDHHAFKLAGQDVLKFFPNVKTNIDIPEVETLWSDNFASLTKTGKNHQGHLYALVGNVAYKVNTENLFKTNAIPSSYHWKGDLLLRFPIGSLTIVPNREDLSYDAKTIQALETGYEATKAAVQSDVVKGIAQCASYNEACRKYIKLHAVMDGIKWWDHKIMCHPSKPGEPITSFAKLPLSEYAVGSLEITRRSKNPRISYWKHDELTLDIRRPTKLYWLPEKGRYLKERLEQISFYYWSDDAHFVVKGSDMAKVKADFDAELIQPCIMVDLSQYHVEPKQANRYRTGNFKLTDGNTLPASSIDETDAYVLMDDGADAKNHWIAWKLHEFRNTVNKYAETNIRVIQLPKSKWSLAKKLGIPNFINIINEQIPALIEKNMETIQRYKAINKHKFSTRIETYCHTTCKVKSTLTKFLTDYNLRKDPSDLITAAETLGIKIPDNKTMEQEVNDIYATYSVFFEHNINIFTHPQLLIAFDQYLEQQKNA